MLDFYWKVLCRALRGTCQFFNLSSLVAISRTVLLWLACTVCIAALFGTQLESQLETTLASAIGVMVLFPIVFLINLLLAPASIYREVLDESIEAKNDLKLAAAIEVYLQELSDLYFKGQEKYKVGFKNEAEKQHWINEMRQWESLAEEKLGTHFSTQALHRFRNGGDFSYMHIDHVDTSEHDNMELLAKYSHRIWNLDEVIQSNATKYELSIVMKHSEK
ncbi:hypothetical protein I7Z51_005099 [Vibrio parahaemolyticus]|uniref:hypothetical protein n=1 Tax=Vibrio parahaemolyticus TaxID=670 RepID=UPI00186A1084|nr:hypothetical protein [Vibrio parahaemolyticus]EGQ7976069.1 hypothetical protein [Vibrio parahaemolyticus]MBE3696377.1 hypothetical protein [Vibrio parahaemolyticus]MCI9692246.1 hypothetical protein [Vibrio parahaemolyticus]MCR9808348.1 hypothetical protein [Vibrio parahaemolyticus]MCR9930123.1 hypothetical protein [Vibrio parahaemolyticus]